MHKAISWWRNQIGLQFILMEFVKSKCYATSNNLIIFRPKLVLVLWFFFWLCKYFESDLAKVIQSQTICQPAITTFPLGLYWKTYLYLFLSKKIAPKWKVIQVSKISLLSKVRDEGGGAFFKTIKSYSQLSCEFCIYMGKKRTEKVAVQRIPPEYQGWWMSMWQARRLASP